MTRGRLVARVASTFGLKTDPGSEELLMLQEWANEAVVDFLIQTHCRVELGDLTLTANVSDYRVDDTVLAVEERSLPLDVKLVTLDEIYDKRRYPSVPGGVTYIAVEGNLALVWPTPTAAMTLRYVYVAKPTKMTDDAHDPSNPTYGGIPEELHYGLEDYMNVMASKYDKVGTPLAPKDYVALYQGSCKEARMLTRKKGGRSLSPARVGYSGGHRVPRRNDVYPES